MVPVACSTVEGHRDEPTATRAIELLEVVVVEIDGDYKGLTSGRSVQGFEGG